MNLEDILGDIDKSFAEKQQQEIYMTYVLVAAVFIAASYLLLWDSAELGFKKTEKEVVEIQKKIKDHSNYLKWNPESKIASLKAQTVKEKQNFVTLKDQSEYIKFKIEQISSLYYDEQAWGEFIDSISENAKKQGLKLEYLTNRFSADKSTFGHVLDIGIKVKGNFHKTMKFINSLEQSFLVVDVHTVKLLASSTVDSELKISVWGITY